MHLARQSQQSPRCRSVVASSLNTLDNFVNNVAPQIFDDQVKAEFGRVKESLLQCAPYLYDIQAIDKAGQSDQSLSRVHVCSTT